MPIEVRIDVIPHGVETARQQMGTVRITQVEKLDDDPEGWRVYAVSGARLSHVKHKRSDGAMRLVALALASDQQLEVGAGEPARRRGARGGTMRFEAYVCTDPRADELCDACPFRAGQGGDRG